MESTALCTSLSIPSLSPRQSAISAANRAVVAAAAARSPRRMRQTMAISATINRRDDDTSNKPSYGGGQGHVVDEGMIVLRKRIGEMKMAEQSYEPPEEWAEWEKQHYAVYGDLVCKSLGVMQRSLMSTRPTFAIGALVILAASVPVSTYAVASRIAEAADGVFSSLHLLG